MAVQIRQLSVWLGPHLRQILDEVTVTIPTGQTVGLVGESGSGKSTMARALLRALPPGKVDGEILFDGQDVHRFSASQLRNFRLRDVAMIGQNPRAAMNPVHRVGDFATEVLRTSKGLDPTASRATMADLLSDVGIHDPERVLDQYPHQLSGGMLQRVVIAAALAVEPKMLIADEPTTALDVTTQAEVMAILAEQTHKRQMSMLFITHDLDLVSAVSDRIAVMYAGRIVEEQASDRLLQHPQHPYTSALAAARTRADIDIARLQAIEGNPIAAYEADPGCSYAPRCRYATPECRMATPPMSETDHGRVACIHYRDLEPTLAPSTTDSRTEP